MAEQKGKEMPKRAPHLRVLWLTPLRALVEDTTRTLEELCEGLWTPWTIQSRTGDTSGSVKAKQRKKYPSCLVTTPESLSLFFSYPETKEAFSDLRAVIVDEWHELLQASGVPRPSFAWPGFENGTLISRPGVFPPHLVT